MYCPGDLAFKAFHNPSVRVRRRAWWSSSGYTCVTRPPLLPRPLGCPPLSIATYQVFLLVFESVNFAHCIGSWGIDAVVAWQDTLFIEVAVSSVLCVLGGILAGAGTVR